MEYSFNTGPVINDEDTARIGQGAVEKIIGRDALVHCEKVTGGEDFALYLEKAPGAMAFVGTGNKEKDTCYAHHHGSFNIDEEGLEIGCALYVQYVMDFLQQE